MECPGHCTCGMRWQRWLDLKVSDVYVERGLTISMKTLAVVELREMLSRYSDDAPVMVSEVKSSTGQASS